jgi:integrase
MYKRETATSLERRHYITPKEFTKLLATCKTDRRAYMLFYVVGNLGLRIIEAHRIKCGDLLKEDPIIKINTAKQGEEVIHELRIAKQVARKMRRFIKDRGLKKDSLLFPWSKRYSQKLWDIYSSKAGLKYKSSNGRKGRGIHSLRHLFGLRLAQAKAPPVLIMKQMRHKSYSSTQQYIHISDVGKIVERLGPLE